MNTRLVYMYRNTSNNKQWGAVVFAGAPDGEISQRLVATLESEEFFTADQEGVPGVFFDDGLDPEDDHCWHEFAALEPTDDEPTDAFARTIESFVAECEAASRAHWRGFDPLLRTAKRRWSSANSGERSI